jgi:hypothetical protein
VDRKINFVDVFSAATKDQAAAKFKEFLVYFERLCGERVLVLRTDGGGEFARVDLFCRENGIARQRTEPHTSASNGKAERAFRTIFNAIRDA